MREIQEYLPEARFIHMIRDGRDVALSILKQSFGPETIEAAAERWRGRVLRGRAQQPYLGFYMEVKFEDLVLQMIAKRPEDRFQTPAALLRDLERIGRYNNLEADWAEWSG